MCVKNPCFVGYPYLKHMLRDLADVVLQVIAVSPCDQELYQSPHISNESKET